MEIGSIAAWGAVAVAVVAVLLAVRQFWLARKAQEQQAEIARANLLLSIDSAFEGPEIYKARKAIRSLRNRIEAEVNASNPEDKSPDAIRAAVATKFSRKLNVMWEVARTFSDEDVEDETSKARIGIDRYYELLTLPNWVETVGMMCVRGLLPKEDILSLYAGVVITTMFNFKSHVEARRIEQPHPNPRFMENAFLLYDLAVAHKKMREEPVKARPALGGIFKS